MVWYISTQVGAPCVKTNSIYPSWLFVKMHFFLLQTSIPNGQILNEMNILNNFFLQKPLMIAEQLDVLFWNISTFLKVDTFIISIHFKNNI